ncbi:MAG: PorT family protein [Bacteroidetes bacterium]|nr:PorT family protein [Bacteroidota bacterium]
MKFRFLVLVLIIAGQVHSQKYFQERYRKFDKRYFHFGFMLGGNTSNFSIFAQDSNYLKYGIKSLVAKSTPGGQLGILTTVKLGTPMFKFRFLPTLSFQERVLQYTRINPDTSKTFDLVDEERVNSTSLDFPMMLLFRTKRLNNFVAYSLIGAQYSIDLQSQEGKAQSFIDPYVKIKKEDWQGQIGGGLEFFAHYFKFAIELKYSHGFSNTFIFEPTNSVSQPIQRLYNKGWWFSN